MPLYDQAPDAPEWVRKVPRALEKWQVIWLALERTRVSVNAHGDFVAQYCIAYSDMRDAVERMRNSKLVKETRTVGVGDKAKTSIEKVTVSPFQGIYDNATRNMERLAKLIGLDPTNPLEEVRKFDDYADILRAEIIGGDDVDNGSDGNAGGDTAEQAEICSGTSETESILDA